MSVAHASHPGKGAAIRVGEQSELWICAASTSGFVGMVESSRMAFGLRQREVAGSREPLGQPGFSDCCSPRAQILSNLGRACGLLIGWGCKTEPAAVQSSHSGYSRQGYGKLASEGGRSKSLPLGSSMVKLPWSELPPWAAGIGGEGSKSASENRKLDPGALRANGSLHLNVAQRDLVPVGEASRPSPGGLLPIDSLVS